MKKKGIIVFFSILSVFCFSGIVHAELDRFAVAAKVGTLGLGAELTTNITQTINTRIGFNVFSYDYEGSESDIDYDVSLDLFSAGVLFDWHPYDGGFRISAGVLYNGNEASADGTPTDDEYTIGDEVYTAADVGELDAKIEFNSAAPYVGIGWGNAVGKDKRWSFVLDIGVIYQGSPSIDLSASGILASDAAFLADLEREEKDLEDDLDPYKYYPVITIGVSYKF